MQKRFEDLTPEEQYIQSKESPELYQEFFRIHQRLAWFIVHEVIRPEAAKLLDRGASMDDYLQIAMLGMLKAYQTFNPERAKWATWASVCIRNELYMTLRRRMKYVKRNIIFESFDDIVFDRSGGRGDEAITLEQTIGEEDLRMKLLENVEFFWAVVERLKRHLSATELKVFEKVLECRQGVTQVTLARDLGISQSYISRVLRRIYSQAEEIRKQLLADKLTS